MPPGARRACLHTRVSPAVSAHTCVLRACLHTCVSSVSVGTRICPRSVSAHTCVPRPCLHTRVCPRLCLHTRVSSICTHVCPLSVSTHICAPVRVCTHVCRLCLHTRVSPVCLSPGPGASRLRVRTRSPLRWAQIPP